MSSFIHYVLGSKDAICFERIYIVQIRRVGKCEHSSRIGAQSKGEIFTIFDWCGATVLQVHA